MHMPDLQTLLEVSASRHTHLCPRQVIGVRAGTSGIFNWTSNASFSAGPNWRLFEPLSTTLSPSESVQSSFRFDGSITAWGWNKYDQCTVPSGNDYVAVTTGGHHNLALESDDAISAHSNTINQQHEFVTAPNNRQQQKEFPIPEPYTLSALALSGFFLKRRFRG